MCRPLAAFVVIGLAWPAHAAEFPERLVRIVVPFPAGGPVDILARAIGQRLSEMWGQPLIVDNRGGAGGSIGTEWVARAAPDGHTLVMGHVGTHAINATLYAKLAYDPVRDFAPVTLVATLPLALVVHPSMPAASVRDLVALARARPGQINFASAGAGGPTHLSGELLRMLAKIDIVHVPYKGNAAALANVMAGEAHMMFSNLLTATPHTRAGKLRSLAIGTAERTPQAPQLPTVAEAGVPGFDVTAWYGILAPAGIARTTLDKLNRDIGQVLALKEFRAKFETAGVDLKSSSSEEFAALIRREVPRWALVVKRSGASAN